MSHQTFAVVWIQLKGRTDIDNILREIIGQSSLDLSLAANSDQRQRSSLRLAVYFKVVFDLQRTYSEDRHLLKLRLLVDAIIHLVRIKSEVFRRRESPSTLPTQYVPQRCFLAQALVSGLRALRLRKYHFSSLLEERIEEAWNGDQLTNLEKFLVRLVRLVVQDGRNNPGSELSSPACGLVQLRNHSRGLYPLESRPNELLQPVWKAARDIGRESEVDTSRWSRNYWILFDIASTTEAALIQLYADYASSKPNPQSQRPTQDDFNQLSTTRKEVLRTIFGSATMDDIAKISIATILLTPYCGEVCNCSKEFGDQQHRTDTASAGSLPLTRYQPPGSNVEIGEFLDESLLILVERLGIRKDDLRDPNGEMSDLLKSLDTSMDKWYSETSSFNSASSDPPDARRNAYVLACPLQHPIPYDVLKGLIEHSDGKIGLQDLNKNSSWFSIYISCSECDDQQEVRSARRIDPLHDLSAIITEKVSKKPLAHHKPDEEVPPENHQHRPSSEKASSHVESNVLSFGDNKLSQRGQLESFFGEAVKEKNKALRTAPSYCFTANGESILLWMRYGAQIIFYDIETQRCEKKPATSVSRAAAGASFYTYVAKSGNGQTWNIRRRIDGVSVICESIPVAYGIACSRDGRYAAIGFANEVWVCDIEDRTIKKHQLPAITSKRLDSQQVGFSADCEKVMVATRTSDGAVSVWSDACMSSTWQMRFSPLRIPFGGGNKDFGLSSLFSDNSSCLCITAFTGKTPPVLLSQGHSPQYLNGNFHKRLGTQIQCAAQSPSGWKLTFVNDKNEIFSAGRESDGNWHITMLPGLKPARKQIASREEFMAITMPDEDTVHLFWIKGNEWFLTAI